MKLFLVPIHWSTTEVKNFSDKMREIDGYSHVVQVVTHKTEMLKCPDMTYVEFCDLRDEYASIASERELNEKIDEDTRKYNLMVSAISK